MSYQGAQPSITALTRVRVDQNAPAPRHPEAAGDQPTEARMRLLYVVGGGPGIADRVDISDLFARRLAAKGLEIDWVMDDPSPGPAWRKGRWMNADAYLIGRARRGGLPGRIANKLRDLGADLQTFWLVLRGDYDLVQVRDKFLVAVLALIAARIRGIRFTYWASYPFAECRILDAREGRARFPILSLIGGRLASWLLYRIILPNADRIFVQSQRMLEDFRSQGIPESAMTPVPMGIGEHLLEYPSLPVTPRTVLYLGTLNLVRRLDTLVEALAIVRRDFPDARLIFVGDGDVPEDRRRLEEAIQAFGLGEAVEITGWRPAAEAHERVRRAAVCVSPFYPTPILLSTSPTKLIEYMALQRPVVANEHPEQSIIIAESGAGLCVPWSAEDFAQAIARLFADPEAAEAMGRRGREYVRSKRLYSLIAEDVAAEYFRLLPRPGRQATQTAAAGIVQSSKRKWR
ncbi:glycosyltransferase family 4 protein [Thiocystis violacea]|uniref:glycosyltransferase family 4 protein n=1 Tax=Thiocystis violacea TaxID=13725 RepID=UPI0019030719|nr:glycosyltransferase family 4 protein [Thiocystis violacea]